MMQGHEKLPLILMIMRFSVFIVMIMWTIDKFVRPEHASFVYQNYFFIRWNAQAFYYVIGSLELLILFCFLLGAWKRFTYGAVLLFHAISTLSAYKEYFSPFQGVNLLFFAAWPMLAACFALYLLRDKDTLFVVRRKK